MRIHELDQGSIEWMQARLGIPTMSQADKLMTPRTHKASGSQDKYRAELIAEWLLGQPLDWGSDLWMQRGQELEDEARKFYAFERGAPVQTVGFVTRDDGLVGGSPDGLVGDDGILEIKCPAAHTHVYYMLGEKPDYIGQCQGYLYLTGRKWVDLLSYNPDLPPVIRRVERDEEYLEAFVPILDAFVERLEADKGRLAEHKVSRPWDPEVQEELRRAGAARACPVTRRS